MNRTHSTLLALAWMAAACSQTVRGPGWMDENLHAVDGYLVTGETRCALGPSDGCGGVVEPAAEAWKVMGPGVTVVGASVASLPTRYIDATGSEILFQSGAMTAPNLVILELADGSRRAVGVFCRGPITFEDGAVAEPRTCFSDVTGLLGAFERYRVGWAPASG